MNIEIPNEKIDIKRLEQLLKDRGWEDPEARELFFEWVAQEEKILDQVPGGESRDNLNVVLLIEQGKLLERAGVYEKASEMFDHAYLLAQNIGREDLYHQAMSQSTDSVM